ncbi:MAG: hypothetical protein KDB23_11390 [Planctomycetales bacterium]|nr:hypothetical protein [Planctomycetales bacterium]
MMSFFRSLCQCVVGLVALTITTEIRAEERAATFAEIQVVDQETERGVPLVTLRTVDHQEFVTDSAGRVAIVDESLMRRPVFFYLQSHGYEYPPDGFGYRGTRVTLVPGQPIVLKIQRQNVAERLYRVTGEGIYRDSVLLGYDTPLAQPLGAGLVAGQDSVFGVPYAERIFWFWGDTARLSYPLGHFAMAGATSPPVGQEGTRPAHGVDLTYFVDEAGFSRPMCRLDSERGVVWADGFTTVKDDDGRTRLVCHDVNLESMRKELSHGLAIYDDAAERFVRLRSLEMSDRWKWPTQAHPIHLEMDGVKYLLMGDVYPTMRVPARLADYQNPAAYEAWSCLSADSTIEKPRLLRDDQGQIIWSWRKSTRPVDQRVERRLVEQGLMQTDEARSNLRDVDTGKVVRLHRGSVHWNEYRRRWIMIAGEQGGDSELGEIWYAEADSPTGPWHRGVKIVTHRKYSFYNPVHHDFLDEDGGRVIYFEGTYTATFSGNDHPTPRYDYNQIMYRLDLADERLKSVHERPVSR